MKSRTIVGIFLVGLMGITFSGCGGGDSSAPTINTNEYNVRALPTQDYDINLNFSYTSGVTGTASIKKVYIGDELVNGISVKSMHQRVTVTTNGSVFTFDQDIGYDSNGIMLLSLDNDDNTICSLQNTPTPLPTAGKVGDNSTISAEYSCTNGTTLTQRWSLTDAGNGNAFLTFTTTFYNVANNVESIEIEKITINSNSVPIFYNLDEELILAQDSFTASGSF